MSEILVEKNEEYELPIPNVWRPIFNKIIKAFVNKDYSLSIGIENVNFVSEQTSKQIKEYIEDYGEELIELPEETWYTSICIYYCDHWSVFIDLFTINEGLSDLVLGADVKEIENNYFVDINLVYVP